MLSTMLKRRGIKHEVLNAKFHEKEVGHRRPGRPDRRGDDRHEHGRPRHRHPARRQPGRPRLRDRSTSSGLNPAEVDKATYDAALAEAKAITDEDHDEVVAAGGLHIIGTERHDARRIDNQLRGRAGRQGDPGSSRFYLSLEDDLMKRFASRPRRRADGAARASRTTSPSSRGSCRKTIESAQSRVEGFNFDIRKRVVEYDDVINKQRETIYAERDKVLRNEDLTETVQALPRRRDRGARRQPPRRRGRRRLGPRGPRRRAQGDGPRRRRARPRDELWELGGREAIGEHLRELADDAARGASEAEVGEEDWATVERLVLLRTIDSLWVEHLTELDDMRRGIGLRGYAQQDPLNEFRREAFRLYEELRGLIRHQVASTIFRVTVTRQPQEAAPMPFDASKLARAGAAPRGTAAAAAGGAAGTGLVRERRRDRRPATGRHAASGGAIAADGAAASPSDPMARALRESTNGSPLRRPA